MTIVLPIVVENQMDLIAMQLSLMHYLVLSRNGRMDSHMPPTAPASGWPPGPLAQPRASPALSGTCWPARTHGEEHDVSLLIGMQQAGAHAYRSGDLRMALADVLPELIKGQAASDAESKHERGDPSAQKAHRNSDDFADSLILGCSAERMPCGGSSIAPCGRWPSCALSVLPGRHATPCSSSSRWQTSPLPPHAATVAATPVHSAMRHRFSACSAASRAAFGAAAPQEEQAASTTDAAVFHRAVEGLRRLSSDLSALLSSETRRQEGSDNERQCQTRRRIREGSERLRLLCLSCLPTGARNAAEADGLAEASLWAVDCLLSINRVPDLCNEPVSKAIAASNPRASCRGEVSIPLLMDGDENGPPMSGEVLRRPIGQMRFSAAAQAAEAAVSSLLEAASFAAVGQSHGSRSHGQRDSSSLSGAPGLSRLAAARLAWAMAAAGRTDGRFRREWRALERVIVWRPGKATGSYRDRRSEMGVGAGHFAAAGRQKDNVLQRAAPLTVQWQVAVMRAFVEAKAGGALIRGADKVTSAATPPLDIPGQVRDRGRLPLSPLSLQNASPSLQTLLPLPLSAV